jgi:glycosyltransferase involved in cell wall biosynthesis
MKILYTTNVVIPQIEKISGIKSSVFGGWLEAFCSDLLNQKNIELIVCCPIDSSKLLYGKKDNFSFYCFTSNQKNQLTQLESIINKENPDIIQIFGTEYPHSYNMIKTCEKKGIINRVVIFIQGLVSIYAKHYTAFLPNSVVSGYTLRDFVKNANIRKSQIRMEESGHKEIYALAKVKHIIGRTDWDKACSSQINPNANYYKCNESLRENFYKHKWEFEKCEKRTIFLSQSSYPIKGFHLMLEAMPLVLRFYPDAKIFITGKNLLDITLKQRLLLTNYNNYIVKLVRKHNLENKIEFLGFLNENEMVDRYLKSNVFVSASSIENSPNSVGEAMLLGVPTISSDVGGVKNMLSHNIDGFVYQADAPYMLAHYICEIFRNDELSAKFSSNSREHALETHDRIKNINAMLSIYQSIKTEEK